MLAGFLMKTNKCKTIKINTDVEHSQNLSTWISQVFSLYLCSTWNRRDCTKRPRHEKKLQLRSAPAARRAPREGFLHGTWQAAEPRWRSRCGPGANITTKAQMTPHFIFVHRNESWNNSFILHYWQRTILTLTLAACSNASISCHCFSSEMKTAL